MHNDIIGDLSEVRLFDLLKPLVDGKKSGMVVIEGAQTGELYIEGGSIVHGKTDTVTGDEAILAIMDMDDGQVGFNWHLSPEKQTVGMLTGQFMSRWAQREEGWRKIKEVMASSNAVFSVVVDCRGEDRTILAKQWGVLALCNGMRNVSDIAALLGRSIFEISETVCEMVGLGILDKMEDAEIRKTRLKETVDGTFFATVETELKKVVGPIARIIMNDTLAAFDESRDAFPKDRVASFLRTICGQIVEEQKRDQFGRAVYAVMIPFSE
jgi:hypothetical protein